MKKSILILAALGALALPVKAVVINGVDVADSIDAHHHTLQLNGAGLRKKAFLKFYVGSLFTLSKINSGSDVVEGVTPAAIRLNITSRLITTERLADALSEGFERATHGHTDEIQNSIHSFVAGMFTEAVSKGDQYTFVSIPGEGVYSFKNGKQVAANHDEAFRKALMSVWLGDEPTDAKLKQQMLHNLQSI